MRIGILLLFASAACAGDGTYCAAWSPDGKWWAFGSDHSLRIVDAGTQKVVRTIPTWSTVHDVRFDATSQRLLFSGKGNTFTIAELDGRIVVKHKEVNPVVAFSAAWSADGKTVLSMGPKKTLLVWKHPFDKPARRIEGGGPLWKYALTADGARAIAVDTEGYLTLWNARDGKKLLRTRAHDGYVFAMQLDRLLATGGSARDRTVALLDPLSLRLVRRIDAGLIVNSLAFSPGGSMLAVGGKNRVHLYDVATGSLRKKWKSGSAGLAFSPDGKRLLTVSTR
ncbi:MAG: hypothetical protein AAGF12_30530, partial [Myxococcota bacterium]